VDQDSTVARCAAAPFAGAAPRSVRVRKFLGARRLKPEADRQFSSGPRATFSAARLGSPQQKLEARQQSFAVEVCPSGQPALSRIRYGWGFGLPVQVSAQDIRAVGQRRCRLALSSLQPGSSLPEFCPGSIPRLAC
jgi:hypothetical protein